MKKAVMDQLFIGFLLGMALFGFAATVIDETSTRNYIYNLKDTAKVAAKTMARYYEQNFDICTSQKIAADIILQGEIGDKLTNEGLISYQWFDTWPDTNGDGIGDAAQPEPDVIRVTIASHKHNTFWYRFFGFDDFNINPIVWEEPINTPKNVTITYGGEDAGYTNMVGLYELDNNGCVINPRLILTNSDNDSLIGTQLGQPILSPPTYIFILSDGYNIFANGSDRPQISDTIFMNHCIGDANPTVTLNGITRTNTAMFFEQPEMNGDGFEHVQIIPKTIWDYYNTYISGGSGRNYNTFIALCNTVNYDNDPNNNIPATNMIIGVNDCKNDINDEYQYAMEDLNGGGDQDFNDIYLDTTRIVQPNNCNCYTMNNDGSLNLNCTDNIPPSVIVSGCPLVINENTTTNAILWTDSDSDGIIVERVAYASNGNAVVNADGTISYTPNANFVGEDIVTLRVRDNEGSSMTDTCTITVLNVNTDPDISGTAPSEVVAGNNYIFVPLATDDDGDSLIFSITNKPSWANFDPNTGQLSGVPTHADIGLYSNIVIMVNDGNGGTDALTFSINVLEDSDNQAPILVAPIPDQTVQEGNAYTYDVSAHFSDPDGDVLTYSGTFFFNGSTYTLNATPEGVITTGIVPHGYVGQTITVTVIASDGVYSATDVFNITITNQEDLPNFFDTFDSNRENWSSTNNNIQWIQDNNDGNNGKLRIYAKATGSNYWANKTYNFGPAYANRDVRITFDMDFIGGWENASQNNSDRFYIGLNGFIVQTHTDIGNGSNQYVEKSYTIIGQTDSIGYLTLHLGLRVSSTGEQMYADNIRLELE